MFVHNGEPPAQPSPAQPKTGCLVGTWKPAVLLRLGLCGCPPLPQKMGLLHNPPNLLFLLKLMAAERQGDRGKNMRRDFPNPHFLSRQQENSWGLNIWEI